MTASAQIAGNTSANIAEVEANTKALRVTLRPEDFGTLGIYSVSQASGTMAAGLTAASRIFSFRWSDSTRFALIKRVTFSAGAIATFGAAAAAFIFNMTRVLSFSVGDTTNRTDITPASTMNKLRTTGMGGTLLAANGICIATTTVISGGTLTTPDTNPLGTLVGGLVAGAGAQIVGPYPIFDTRPGEHPLLLAQNEGFKIEATVPGTGTWQFGVKVDWTEIAAY